MGRKKRAQATIFIIAGIVILALVILFFAGRKAGVSFLQVGQEDLRSEMDKIETQVLECMADSAKAPLDMMGKQGGFLSVPEKSYRYYEDYTISYLCWNQVARPTCTNRLLTLEGMEDELTKAIKNEMKECLNIKKFAGALAGYTIDAPSTYDLEVDIRSLKVFINMEYPIVLKGKEGAEVSKKDFQEVVDYPVGQLYDVAQDILNFETQFGEFDQLMYMLQKKGKFMIYKRRPYPDKIYVLKRSDNPYIFQFAVEGESL